MDKENHWTPNLSIEPKFGEMTMIKRVKKYK